MTCLETQVQGRHGGRNRERGGEGRGATFLYPRYVPNTPYVPFLQGLVTILGSCRTTWCNTFQKRKKMASGRNEASAKVDRARGQRRTLSFVFFTSLPP